MSARWEWQSWVPEHWETPDVPPPTDPGTPEAWTIPPKTATVLPTRSAVGAIDGRVYLAGGTNAGSFTSACLEYDPATNVWTTKAAMPGPRWMGTTYGVIGGKLYVAGGQPSNTANSVSQTLFSYDPAANSWATLAPPPVGFGVASVGGVVGGKLYASNPARTVLYAYDPATNTWATVGGPVPIAGAGRGFAGRLYVVGGTSMRSYDPATNTWRTEPAPPNSHDSGPAVVVANGRLYVLGNFSTTERVVDRFDPVLGTWATLPLLPSFLASANAAVVAGKIYAFPNNGNVYTATAPDGPANTDGSGDPITTPDPEPVLVPGSWATDPDRTEALETFTAGHGRADANTKPSPATCTLQLAAQFAPVAPVPGERFRLRFTEAACTELGLALDAEARVRFTGEVTDAVTDNPKRLVDRRHQVTGVGRWARGSRYVLDPSGYPREAAAARVARILAAAPAAAPGDVDADATVLGRLDARLTAGQLVDAVMESTGSLLVETRAGALDWHGPDHRRGAAPVLTLDALEVFRDGFTWQRRLSDLVNDVTVQLLDGSTIRLRDGFSVDAYGPSPATVGTELVDQSDAYSLAQLILSRRARPSWQLPAVQVDVLRIVTDPVKRRLLLALTTGDRLTITGLPPSPDAEAITELDVFVEGVTERVALSPGRHDTPTRLVWRLTFAVADSALSSTTLRWLDVPADVTWGAVDPTITWLDLGRIENATDLT